MVAAIEAARRGNEVTIFEKKDSVGKKILATGNGRCNFTNMNMSEKYYYTDNPEFIKIAYDKFGNRDLILYMMGLGLLSKVKNGYVYPASEQASSVLDSLLYELFDLNVNIVTNACVSGITEKNNGFEIVLEDEKKFSFDKVILSTGGRSGLPKKEHCNSYELLESLNIKYTRLYPALTQVKAAGIDLKPLSGVRSDCNLHVFADGELQITEEGEVLFTDYGLSGIVTFQVSHFVAEMDDKKVPVTIVLDLIPGVDYEEFEDIIRQRLLLLKDRTVEEFFAGIHNRKLNEVIIKLHGLDPNKSISDYDSDVILECALNYKEFMVPVKGVKGYDSSQVTAGGIPTDLLTESFEVKNHPGLFVTGELINVDGICGGFNLQWAFSSGYIAGNAV